MSKQDELELDAKGGKSGNKLMIIVIMLVSVLLVSGTVIGVLYFTGMLNTGDNSDAKQSGEQVAAEQKEPPKPAFYLDLNPPFVVNFEEQTHATYLQIEMQVMARDKLVIDMVRNHMPVIRNNILLVMSGQKFEDVRTRAGKERLQQQLLATIQEVVAEAMRSAQKPDKDGEQKADAKPANVEQVYFTSFIMQ